MRSIILFFVFLAVAGGSGCKTSPASTPAFAYTLSALDGASAGFKAWDAAHQEALVHQPGMTEELATARTAAYRKVQEKVLAAFTLAYVAADVVENGGNADLAGALTNVLTALHELEVLP